MRVIFMGTPEFALPAFEAVRTSGEELVAVVTRPDRPAGRGQKVVPPPVKRVAEGAGTPVLQPEKMKAPSSVQEISSLVPDLIVVVAFGQILPTPILSIPRRGCVNLHASLLPKYRGAAPIQWAIINGEKETGATTILMDKGMDTGDILFQERVEIRETDTAATLSTRLAQVGAGLVMKTIDAIKKETLTPIPQEESRATYAPMLKKEDGRIDWTKEAGQIYNLIRGTDPWPGAYTFYQGERWRIISARPENGTLLWREPGELVAVNSSSLLVATGSGLLKITEIQPANGRRMSVREYLTGHPVQEGVILHGVSIKEVDEK